MMLTDLLTTLEAQGALKKSRVPAMKTSLKYLASALGHVSPEQCPADAALRQEATWAKALEDHWRALEALDRTISAYTRRNTRNDIRKVFQLAEAHALIQAPRPPRLLEVPRRKVFERQQRATAPYQTTYARQSRACAYALPQAEWPPDIQAGWREYQVRCGLRLRETTFAAHAKRLTYYLGYLTNIAGRMPTWEDLFAVAQLDAFVRWHAARLERPITTQGHCVAQTVAAIATGLKLPASRALADFRNTLPTPEPTHDKRLHWLSLATLEAVADDCLAQGRVPLVVQAKVRHHGVERASTFARGVMLKLLVRVPLRSRNLREMRLERNLYHDQQTGHWHLRFSGSDLKIGTRKGIINEYKMDLTEHTTDFIPVLEEFIREYRPRLPGSAASTLLFLTRYGRPFSQKTLCQELSSAVALRTGKRFYPHLIRTIWATEYLTSDDTPDWTTAAVMLGDTVATVMAHYHDLVDQAHHPKAKAFVGRALRTG